MNHEEWLQFIPSVARQVEPGSRYLVLRAEQGAEDIAAAEQALQRSLPAYLKQALLDNAGKSAWSMLETLAHLLTPGADPLRLPPTGKPTAHLFPTLVRVLETVTDWAVFFDVDKPERSLIGGVRPAQRIQDWACYLPVGNEALRAEEQQTGAHLSPQMQQFYLLMGGAPDNVTPYVTGVQDMMRGGLYESIYGLDEVQEQLQLPEELLQLLQDWVELTYTIDGDSFGFFASEPRRGDEYRIYQWITDERRFAPLAEDFSEFIELLLTGEYWRKRIME